eukprot:CAMPEP_0196664526 /NCGR_PEP_ID=MMETSP1086-20130531/57509_1 /TAXON_ID=77921 /ORGANISM="Cyanoptyche  gloeocystis , Strain SAG4.97" /LENGTH=96 /DNA_ID=CAMNT_0042000883 /DNA_START=27 /DNA_END=317 /DNA_ORIENTATION=-
MTRRRPLSAREDWSQNPEGPSDVRSTTNSEMLGSTSSEVNHQRQLNWTREECCALASTQSGPPIGRRGVTIADQRTEDWTNERRAGAVSEVAGTKT